MTKRALQPTDMFALRSVGHAQVCPQGKLIAYVVKRTDEEEDKTFTDLHLYNTETKCHRRLTNSGKDHSPYFCPQSKRLAFISTRSGQNQIWILPLDGGEAWHLPTDQNVSGPLLWTPDGHNIIYTAQVFSKEPHWQPYPGAPNYDKERLIKLAQETNGKTDNKQEDKKRNKVKVIVDFKYRRDGVGYFGHVKHHVFITPVPHHPPDDGLISRAIQITEGDYNHYAPALSPQGDYVIVSARRTPTADLDGKQDLWLFSIDGKVKHLLYNALGNTGQSLWSPCGNYVAFTGDDNAYGLSTTTHLSLLPIREAMTSLKSEEHIKPLSHQHALPLTSSMDRPVGAYGGTDLRFSGTSYMFWHHQELYFLMSDAGIAGIYKANLKGDVTPVNNQERSITSLHGVGGLMVYSASNPTCPEELYFYNGQEHLLTQLNTTFIKGIRVGQCEHTPYTSDDGQQVDGWIVYPSIYDSNKRYPLALLIHGGPHGAYGPSFMFMAQLLCSQGYLVLYTNPRGSETYGQRFAACIDKNWGDRDYADVMAGVDMVIGRGLVDETKMFAFGWSYGGYLSCWISTQTSRFKALCAGASVTNLLSDYGTSDITLSDEWEYGGQPWRDEVHLLAHSPLKHVEKVASPLLLLHGENDLRCPISQSEEFYIALKRLGKEAVMVRYPDEFHGPKRPVHILDRYERILAWFNYHRDN